MADLNEIDQVISLFERNVHLPSPTYNDSVIGLNAVNSVIREIEAIIKTTGTTGYKFFDYDLDGNIVRQDIYSDTAGLVLAFTVTYDYTGDDLTLITVERESDGFTYTKTLAYDIDGNLTSITIEEI
jgi:hypothetical protein